MEIEATFPHNSTQPTSSFTIPCSSSQPERSNMNLFHDSRMTESEIEIEKSFINTSQSCEKAPTTNESDSYYPQTTNSSDSTRMKACLPSLPVEASRLIVEKPIKKRRKKEYRQAGFEKIIIKEVVFKNVFHVHGDISITSDLQIRLGGAATLGLIGLEYLRGTKVTSNAKTVEVEMEFSGIPSISLEEVIGCISRFESPLYKKFQEGLSLIHEFFKCRKIQALENKMTVEDQEQCYDNFCRESRDFIASRTQTESLFGYIVGRCNNFTGKVDIKHMGYSREFLNLLCLNSDLLQQMFLRNKHINIDLDPEQLQELSLIHMDCRIHRKSAFSTRMQITTIDGYNLWVNQSIERVVDMHKEGRDSSFFQNVIKFDIELHDLQGLIDYRQSLSNSKGIGFDRLVQAELSQLLEDVEYSVQSQLFMEKYYKQSVQELTDLMHKLQDTHKEEEKKRCGFRTI